MRHAALFLVIAFISFSVLYAENEVEKVIDLSELKLLTLKYNPEIQALLSKKKAAVYAKQAAGSLPDPKLSLSEFIEEVQTRVGPQRRKFSISQMFPWFGTLSLEKKLADQRIDVENEELRSLIFKVFRELEYTLLDIELLKKKIKINREHAELLKTLESSQKGSMKSNRGFLTNTLRIQVEKEKLIDEISSLESMLPVLKQKCISTVGKKIEQDLPNASVHFQGKLEKDELRKSFITSNPMWLKNQKNKQIAEKKIALAKKKNYPNFSLGFSWIDLGPAQMPFTAGSGDNPMAFNLSLDIPLWRRKIKANINKEKQRRLMIDKHSEFLLREFDTKIQLHQYHIKDNLRKIDLYQKTLLPKSQDAYRSAKNAYTAGRVSFQNVLDAERLVLQISLDLETAKINLSKANIDVLHLLGQRSIPSEVIFDE